MTTGTEHLPDCPFCGGRPQRGDKTRFSGATHMHLECEACKHRITQPYMAGSERKARNTLDAKWVALASQRSTEELPPPVEMECDICGHISTDPEGRHYCSEDNSDD